ncbi:hypothetical protein [Kineosporia babensis]|uniref:Uncharacterized protein n=1 Tax=Kineosporia babensis TaxID=499548 RepID=A0A9X1NM11_9ACTN|nr:hypothetical protein [Kineosporia babensis]MCD5316613.1 hypothetical protein [Kineosporia babensis]
MRLPTTPNYSPDDPEIQDLIAGLGNDEDDREVTARDINIMTALRMADAFTSL